MSHVTHTKESRHTYQWVTSHIPMSHVTHTNESRHAHESVILHIRISHVTYANELYHTYERVVHRVVRRSTAAHDCRGAETAREPMSHVTKRQSDEEWVMSHVNEWDHTYEWDTSHNSHCCTCTELCHTGLSDTGLFLMYCRCSEMFLIVAVARKCVTRDCFTQDCFSFVAVARKYFTLLQLHEIVSYGTVSHFNVRNVWNRLLHTLMNRVTLMCDDSYICVTWLEIHSCHTYIWMNRVTHRAQTVWDRLLHTCLCGQGSRYTYTLQHTASHCYTLQHTATHCNTCLCGNGSRYTCTLQHTATHCNTLQHTAAHCSTLQHNATLSNTQGQDSMK